MSTQLWQKYHCKNVPTRELYLSFVVKTVCFPIEPKKKLFFNIINDKPWEDKAWPHIKTFYIVVGVSGTVAVLKDERVVIMRGPL